MPTYLKLVLQYIIRSLVVFLMVVIRCLVVHVQRVKAKWGVIGVVADVCSIVGAIPVIFVVIFWLFSSRQEDKRQGNTLDIGHTAAVKENTAAVGRLTHAIEMEQARRYQEDSTTKTSGKLSQTTSSEPNPSQPEPQPSNDRSEHAQIAKTAKTSLYQEIPKPVPPAELEPPKQGQFASHEPETPPRSSEDHSEQVRVVALEETPLLLKNHDLSQLLHGRIFLSSSSDGIEREVAAALGKDLRHAGFDITPDRKNAALIMAVAIQNDVEEPSSDLSGGYIVWTTTTRLKIRVTQASDNAVLFMELFEGKGQANDLSTAKARALLDTIDAGVHRFQAKAEQQR